MRMTARIIQKKGEISFDIFLRVSLIRFCLLLLMLSTIELYALRHANVLYIKNEITFFIQIFCI